MKFKSLTATLICIILLLTSQNISMAQEQSRENWKKFKGDFVSPGLKVIWDEHTGVPRMILGMKLAPLLKAKELINKKVISKIAFDFLKKYEMLVKIPTKNVKLKKINQFQNKWYVKMQTYYKGIPFTNGKVGFTLDKGGNILTYASDYDPGIELTTDPKILKDEALKIAFKHHKPGLDLPVIPKETYLTIYQHYLANGARKYTLTWYIFLGTNAGHLEVDRVFIIDALTGKIIKDYYPYPFSITGVVQGETYPEHSTDAVVTVPFEHLEVTVPLNSTNTDAAGNYILNPGAGSYTLTMKLEGDFARVQSYDSVSLIDQDIEHTASVTDPGNHDFTWTSSNSSPDDGDGLNTFWHANRLHDDYYLAILGISWNNAWTGTSQMRYSVNRGNDNNAYAGNPIWILSDAAARNCDIVYHETTHNVLYDMFGGWIGFPDSDSEGYAFDEGFSDYVACSFNNDSQLGENVITPRNCDNNMQYPGTSYNIEGHAGGQLISGAAWDLWDKEGLNHNDTDVLLFSGLNQMATLPGPYYFSNPNYSNYLTSLLQADDNNNNLTDGTPHDRQIFQAFRYHDLLPVDVFCKDSPQDDGNVPSQGNHWTSPDIWVRNNQDNGTVHQNPIYNQANYIYIKVRNLGYLQADTINVKAYWADPAGGIPWPSDWNYIGESTVTNLAANSDIVATPISWTPTGTAIGHRCLLVRLECDQDLITEEGNVKYDNNIAQKNITIIEFPPFSPLRPIGLQFFLRNYRDAQMDLVVEARKIQIVKGGIMKPIKDAVIPIRVELRIPKLQEFRGSENFTYTKYGKCFLRKLFHKPLHKLIMKGNNGQITEFKLKKYVTRALNKIRFVPLKPLEPGDTYEFTIKQIVNKEVVGGLTYIIRTTKKVEK